LNGPRSALHLLDGSHPFRDAVPQACVDYPAKRRGNGKVFLFNFELAREMGVLPPDAPDVLDRELKAEILQAFSLQIVNEYDMEHDPKALTGAGSRRFMATRYLQLQHPDRRGSTSGDGRSIWNGTLRNGSHTWDVSSCGTGATRLSPATAIHKRFFRTGDKSVSYGCGRAWLWDALCAALMSESLHVCGIRTERTLAIIDYGDGTCVAVRAYPNLLRPAHLFLWLKQGDRTSLQAAVDYHITRECEAGRFPRIADQRQRYLHLLEHTAGRFAEAAARFESDYIFCWMDWDGDNVLLDGGIIDYGSVRQFGLFHHEYRYDDVERMSTTIVEQRQKARYIIQTMAQLIDFLIEGRKSPIASFRSSAATKAFDREFERWRAHFLVERIGFPPELTPSLLADSAFMRELREFARHYRHFERTKSKLGPYRVTDGITWDAVFCMRDLLRELPERLCAGAREISAEEFIDMMRSSYASERDVRLYPARRVRVRRFQRSYSSLIRRAAVIDGRGFDSMLRAVAFRSAQINRYDRITGDGVLIAAKRLLSAYKDMNHKEMYSVFRGFVDAQRVHPATPVALGSEFSRRLHGSMLQAIRAHREGL
jgi:uncharacterized protein YdiU (UPF0061 family)